MISVCRSTMLKDEKKLFNVEAIKLAPQSIKRKMEQRFPKLLSAIIGIYHTDIPYTIWRCTKIQDEEDFKKLLPLLACASSNAKVFSKACNTYLRRKTETLKLSGTLLSLTDSKTINAALSKIIGSDWTYLLKQKESFDELKDEEEQKLFIMGSVQAKKPDSDAVLEKFLQTSVARKVSNKNKYPSIEARQEYLKSKFQEFKFSDQVESNDDEDTEFDELVEPQRKKPRISLKRCNKQSCKQFKTDPLVQKFIQKLDDSNMITAFACIMKNFNAACTACLSEICSVKEDDFDENGVLNVEKVMEKLPFVESDESSTSPLSDSDESSISLPD
uniref:Uncharacterized protein n=1 Tax=Panagrolaimus superbus TaxID=310955 RepID=A0A914YJY1_9BILA